MLVLWTNVNSAMQIAMEIVGFRITNVNGCKYKDRFDVKDTVLK